MPGVFEKPVTNREPRFIDGRAILYFRQLRIEECDTGIFGISSARHCERIARILDILLENRGFRQAQNLVNYVLEFCSDDRVIRGFLEYREVQLDRVVTGGLNEVPRIARGPCFVQQRLVYGWFGLGFDFSFLCRQGEGDV